jgi:SAM-dependent methyltransferase
MVLALDFYPYAMHDVGEMLAESGRPEEAEQWRRRASVTRRRNEDPSAQKLVRGERFRQARRRQQEDLGARRSIATALSREPRRMDAGHVRRVRATLFPMTATEEHASVRRSYDTVAEEYAAGFRDEIAGKPFDRALLTALLEQAEKGAPVADLGCGPGHVSAWLAAQGATAVGIDLSAEMVAVGRREFPQVEFRQGDLLDLPAGNGEFGAVVAFYSVIHLHPSELHGAFTEMHRVLRPNGTSLVSFHIGSEVRHLAEWWGHEVDVDFRFFETQDVVEAIEDAGFLVDARLERRNHPGEVETRRGYLVARRRD